MSAENGHQGLLKIGEAAKRIGVNTHTLQRWHQKGEGLQPSLVTPGGHRFYSVHDVEAYCSRNQKTTLTVGYLWSLPDEPAEVMERRRDLMDAYLRQQGWKEQVVMDRGLADDMERPGLRELLQHLVGGMTETLVIEGRDCLDEAGASLVETLCDVLGIPVVCVQDSGEDAPSLPRDDESPEPGLFDEAPDSPGDGDVPAEPDLPEPDAAPDEPAPEDSDVVHYLSPESQPAPVQIALL